MPVPANVSAAFPAWVELGNAAAFRALHLPVLRVARVFRDWRYVFPLDRMPLAARNAPKFRVSSAFELSATLLTRESQNARYERIYAFFALRVFLPKEILRPLVHSLFVTDTQCTQCRNPIGRNYSELL